jgi:hypothetical protein
MRFSIPTVSLGGSLNEIVQREGYAGFRALNAPIRLAAQARAGSEH